MVPNLAIRIWICLSFISQQQNKLKITLYTVNHRHCLSAHVAFCCEWNYFSHTLTKWTARSVYGTIASNVEPIASCTIFDKTDSGINDSHCHGLVKVTEADYIDNSVWHCPCPKSILAYNSGIGSVRGPAAFLPAGCVVSLFDLMLSSWRNLPNHKRLRQPFSSIGI